jgi:ABC-type dipeptide/oligopeptide/nickel transport system permease component
MKWLKRHYMIITMLGSVLGVLIWLRSEKWLDYSISALFLVAIYAAINWDMRRRERNGDFL